MKLDARLTVILTLAAACLFAQDTRTSTLVGVVSDSTGAIVPGATVSVVNTQTSAVSNGRTNSEGSYYIPFLAIGSYELTVEAAGFKKHVQSGVELRAGETPRLNIQLEVGNVSESVRVTTSTPLLETETATVGEIITAQVLSKMPIQQQKPQRVLYYFEGVIPISGYHILGQPEQQLGFAVDGINAKPSIRATLGDTNSILQPTLDAFEEVRIWTTGTPAEVGHAAGGLVNFTFKSGTNQFHGSMEDRYQEKPMVHRQYFEQNERAFPSSYHELQTTVMGPVYIPKLYNGKNKTFFLFGYGRHHEKSNDPQTATTPTLDMLNGNFALGGLGFPIYDPKSIRQTGATTWTADLFANRQIPVSRFDPVAVKFLSLKPYAAPNTAGFFSATGPNNNLAGYTVYRAYRTRVDAKIDQQFTPNHKIFGRYSYNRHRQLGRIATQYSWKEIDSTSFSFGDPEPIDLHNFAFSDYYTFNPTLINEVRLGYNRRNDTVTPATLDQGWASKLGIPNVGPQTFPGFAGLGSFSATPGGSSRTLNEDITFQDNMTKVAGRHTFKWGYEVIRTRENDISSSTPSGNYTFGAAGTALPFTPNTGNAFASFLLGAVSSANFTQLLNNYLPRWWSHAGYFQDDFKPAHSLTLNIGLRYSYESPFQTKYGTKAQFDPTVIDPLTGQLGAITHPKGAVSKSDWNNFQPRLGLAWNFRPKWVFRGSFSVMTQDNLANAGSEEYVAQSALQQAPGVPLPAFYLSQGPTPFSYKLNPDGTAPFIGTNYSSRNATYVDPDLRVPYSMNWASGFQAQISETWLAEALYQGSAAVGLSGTVNINVLPKSIYDSKNLTLLNQVSTATQNYLPYTQFGSINKTGNFGHSTYHGMITRIEKRFSRGLSYNGNFTWSKSLSGAAGAGWQYYDWRLTKGVSNFDTRARLISNVSYELPVGKGRSLMNVGGWRNQVFGGWNLLWVQTVMSGQPVTFTFAGSPSRYLPGPSYPNQILPSDQVKTPDWSIGANRFPQSAQNPYYNINAFAYPAAFTPGTLGVGSQRAGWLIWPQYSLAKSWALGERVRFNLRFDANNIPVRPWLNNPNSVVNLTSPQSFAKFPTTTSTSTGSLGGANGNVLIGARLQW